MTYQWISHHINEISNALDFYYFLLRIDSALILLRYSAYLTSQLKARVLTKAYTATCWSWIFPESNFLYSGDPIRFNQFNCISRLAKPSFVLLIFWKCKTESSEIGLNKFLRRYYQKWTKVVGYLLPSLRRCGIE